MAFDTSGYIVVLAIYTSHTGHYMPKHTVFDTDQFRKIIMRYKRIGYNLNVMRQSACLVINPITVDGYATLFNCTPVDRASDSMMAPT